VDRLHGDFRERSIKIYDTGHCGWRNGAQSVIESDSSQTLKA
jgi:hypothetical protein